MVIGIIGENCSGKSTLAEAIQKDMHAEIVTGKDYLRMAKSESEAPIQGAKIELSFTRKKDKEEARRLCCGGTRNARWRGRGLISGGGRNRGGDRRTGDGDGRPGTK